jgi:nitrogen fixation/metabolism regulation signal transduction histidine kinase
MSDDLSTQKSKKKQKMPWVLGSFVLILLTFLFLLQSSNVWKNISVDSARDTILLYALSSLNFIAFIIFAFILIRSLLKLRQERRALQLGSKIKTRLVMYFVAISLLPLIAMAVFSYLFMNRALERWFTQIPENVVRQAGEIQDKTNKEYLEKFKKVAPMLAKSLENKEITDGDLEEIINVGSLVRLDIISNEKKVLATAQKKLTDNRGNELQQTFNSFYRAEIDNLPKTIGKDLDLTIADMSGDRKLIMVSDTRSTADLEQIAQQSLVQFDLLKSQQIFVRQIGMTTLGLLTFLLIFASSWIAFYIAKGLTRPIRALAVGADEIARGNYSYRVNIFAEDELRLLVQSFNTMSGKLEESSAELKERRKYIETILQSLSTGVISFDGKNRVTTINKAAIKMFNLEDTDFANLQLKQLVNQENSLILEKLIMRSKRIGQATEQTVLQREQIGGNQEANENLPVALTATALPDENGAVLVIEDLTELITAQRASAWQEVARRMAHEIKNPLTPIQLSAERIAKRFTQLNGAKGEIADSSQTKQTTKIIREGTQTILREVSTLKSMVDEFSRYARLPKVKLKEGDINEVINQATLLYEDRIDEVKIEMNLAKTLPNALIDDEQLKRVFVNLIDNAYEAFESTKENKIIRIRTFHDSARDIIVAEVSDNGKGINPGNIQKLFQPYFSTKGRGTGLGLAIVQRIISEHGGQIKAVTNSQGGAKFIIEIGANT